MVKNLDDLLIWAQSEGYLDIGTVYTINCKKFTEIAYLDELEELFQQKAQELDTSNSFDDVGAAVEAYETEKNIYAEISGASMFKPSNIQEFLTDLQTLTQAIITNKRDIHTPKILFNDFGIAIERLYVRMFYEHILKLVQLRAIDSSDLDSFKLSKDTNLHVLNDLLCKVFPNEINVPNSSVVEGKWVSAVLLENINTEVTPYVCRFYQYLSLISPDADIDIRRTEDLIPQRNVYMITLTGFVHINVTSDILKYRTSLDNISIHYAECKKRIFQYLNVDTMESTDMDEIILKVTDAIEKIVSTRYIDYGVELVVVCSNPMIKNMIAKLCEDTGIEIVTFKEVMPDEH